MARRRPWWLGLSSEKLLDVRLCDLELEIEGTALEERLERLQSELALRGLRFRPYAWLSSEWFTPDGHTGFAIPFFLAHPRLARLEHHQMFEVEGGSHAACMKLLRHETAHALDNAYRLHRRRRWREAFGLFSAPYRETYVPQPVSRDHVHHLDWWYAQSHPVEDWAESFSVWLEPRSRWRTDYAGWPALRKLEAVDALMHEVADRPPLVRTRRRTEPLGSLRSTLRAYYRWKKAAYGQDAPDTDYDDPLHRLFSDDPAHARRPTAAGFLERSRRELRARVASVTGQHPYLIDQVLNEMVPRCRALRLRLVRSERETLIDAAVLLATLAHHFAHGSHPVYRR